MKFAPLDTFSRLRKVSLVTRSVGFERKSPAGGPMTKRFALKSRSSAFGATAAPPKCRLCPILCW